MGDNGIKAQPHLKDKLGLKCWALRESRLSLKAIAVKLGHVSEFSVKQLICRNRQGLEAEIAGLEAEDAKLRRLAGAKERTKPRSKSMACQASIFGLLLHQLTCRPRRSAGKKCARVRLPTTLSTRQKTFRKQTESLQRRDRRKCATFCPEQMQQSVCRARVTR